MKLVFAILMMTTSAFASDLKMTELVQARPASSVMVDELDEVIASGTNLDRVTQLLDMYAQGMAPSQEETEGWWSGRCYYKAEPNTPNGALMVVWQITLPPINGGANEGPLFPEEPPTRVFNLGVIGNQNKIADQYDHITPTVKKDVSKTLNSAEALPLNSEF